MTWKRMDRQELSSLITFASLGLVAAMALVCRNYVDYQGEAIQLLLATVSIATVALLATASHPSTAPTVARWIFAILIVANFIAWSSSVAFSILLILPVAFSVSHSRLLELVGWKIQLSPWVVSQPEWKLKADTDDNAHAKLDPESSHQSTNEPLSPVDLEQDLETSPLSELEEEPAEDDPWSVVQQQFKVDHSLTHNLAQWEQPDGSRCIVANVRCQFSTAKETCVVHLPFWPLLSGQPEVFCRVAAGPDATVKTTDVRSHGIRLEARLKEPATEFPVDVIVEVVATSPAVSANEQAA